MATLSIEIPDAQLPRVAAAFGHPGGGPGAAAAVKAALVQFLRDRAALYEMGVAGEAARAQARARVEAEVNPT